MSRVDQFIARLREAATAREAEESACSRTLRERKRNHRDRLSHSQAAELAARLDAILRRRAAALKGRKGELVARAFGPMVGVKELYKLSLPPGTNAATRTVRLSLSKYEAVAKAIAQLLGEPVDNLRRELLSGTSIVPANEADTLWTDVDTVLDVLQDTVDRLARRHGWLALYQRTASLRLQHGGRITWPLSPVEAVGDPRDPHDMAELERMALAASDPGQVYYRRFESEWSHLRLLAEKYLNGGQLQDDSFFFVPHAPIGHIELWDLPQRHVDPVGHERCRLEWLAYGRQRPDSLGTPDDDWSNELNAPRGQASTGKYAYPYFTWLVAYPHKNDSSRLVPALYQCAEEGGAWLMPLDRDTLTAVADAVWTDGHRDASLIDRLIELLQPMPGGSCSEVEMALDRTGPWLAMNPVLTFEQERQRQLQTAVMTSRRGTPN